ncbi:hypothetical protein [Actinophytocola sediminis]
MAPRAARTRALTSHGRRLIDELLDLEEQIMDDPPDIGAELR